MQDRVASVLAASPSTRASAPGSAPMRAASHCSRSSFGSRSSFVAATGWRRTLAFAGVCILSPVLSLAAVRDTRAATIDTYDFTQGGYTSTRGFLAGVLTGHFTGAVEANGFIELADLSSLLGFLDVMPLGVPAEFVFDGPPSFFSFDTAGSSSSLNFETTNMFGNLCVGATAALGATGCGSGGVNGALVEPEFVSFTTQDLPVVTLVSSVTTGVLEPSTWAMMLLGFAGLGFVARQQARRKSSAI